MDLNLQDKKWKEFTFQEIFIIERGEQGVYKKDLQAGIYPYVSASANNNGITDRINRKNRPKNQISIAYDGSTGSAFFHDYEWFASEKVVSVDLKNWKLNRYIANFLIQAITKQKEKFGYGYKWSVGIRMNRSKIVLPIDGEGNPDYAFMEAYMKDIEKKMLDKYRQFIAKRLYIQDIKMGGVT